MKSLMVHTGPSHFSTSLKKEKKSLDNDPRKKASINSCEKGGRKKKEGAILRRFFPFLSFPRERKKKKKGVRRAQVIRCVSRNEGGGGRKEKGRPPTSS